MTEREPTAEEIREALEEGTWYTLPVLPLFRMALRAAEAEARAEREARAVREQIEEGGGYWRSCSGCYETNEGYATGPACPIFNAPRGGGCRECGGIGVVWDDTDYGDMGDYLAALATPRPASPSPATVEAMAEALRPFAEVLSVYREFAEHQLLLLSEDNPKGRRLAHLLPEQFRRAENVFDAYRKEMGDAR